MARRMKLCLRCMWLAAWLPTLAAACWVGVFVVWTLTREASRPTIEQSRPAVAPIPDFDPVRVVTLKQ